MRIEVIGSDQASAHTAVHRSSFGGPKFTDERWNTMAAGLPYADARSLVLYDDLDAVVAAVTVWSAGPGKPGLLEPMGVHSDHRGHGDGTAISAAAAAALRNWARRARSSAPPVQISVPSLPTFRPASEHALKR